MTISFPKVFHLIWLKVKVTATPCGGLIIDIIGKVFEKVIVQATSLFLISYNNGLSNIILMITKP